MLFRYLSLAFILLLPLFSFSKGNKQLKLKYDCETDTCLVNKLNGWSKKKTSNNPDTALFVARKALNIASSISFDKGKADSYYIIADVMVIKGDYMSANQYLDTALQIATKVNNKKQLIAIINLQGIIASDTGNYDASIEKYNEAEKIANNINFKKGIANSYSNLGVTYYYQGEYQRAIENYLKGLKILEEIQDSVNISVALSNLAVFYQLNDQWDKSLETLYKSVDYIGMENYYARASAYNNIAIVLHRLKQLEMAKKYHLMALEMREKIGNQRNVASSYNNLASIYRDLKEFHTAAEYLLKAISIAKKNSLKSDEALYLRSLATVYFYDKSYKLAFPYALKSMQIADSLNLREMVKDNYYLLADIYYHLGNYKKSAESLFNYREVSDSLLNNKLQQTISDMEAKYEDAKKMKRIELLEKDKALQQTRMEKKETLSRALIGGILMVLLVAFVSLRSYYLKKKDHKKLEDQNKKISSQKAVIEEKNKDILDSIAYAKRIQETILPQDAVIKKHLPESFVLYKPKDLVSGDFYWFRVRGDRIFFSAVDCTGHGVPGAFVSIMGYTGLNRALNEYKLQDPAAILDNLNEYVEETFSKEEEIGLQDGMDLSLCSLNIGKHELQYAGANNPLWLLRAADKGLLMADKINSQSVDIEQRKLLELKPDLSEGMLNLFEVKADKQPIGKFAERIPFASHAVQLKKGDTIYIFSDGFADQFGGPKGKKFKYKPFKELLLSIQNKTMDGQKQILDEYFEAWKGDLEQVDDVCVIGVRV